MVAIKYISLVDELLFSCELQVFGLEVAAVKAFN